MGTVQDTPGKTTVEDSTVHYKQEKHLKNVRQLTFGGDNAEAYFSFDNTKITFQATNEKWNVPCDQIYFSALDNFTPTLLSTGKGRTTCSYFLRGDTAILYASTHLAGVLFAHMTGAKLLHVPAPPLCTAHATFVCRP